jgi:nucleotide-binding universal stress UspA family protein
MKAVNRRLFSRMLVCTGDGGFGAVRSAARLAATSGATLTIVEVIDESQAIVRPVGGRGWNVPMLARTQALTRLQRAATRARRVGIEAQTKLLVGTPVRSLAREVARGHYDLLLISASAEGGLRGIGATAARVVRECPIPVLVVRPRPFRRHPRVLLAIDTGRWRGIPMEAVNRKLFDSALWFAHHTRAELHVIHAWEAYSVGVMRRAGATNADARRHLAEVQADRKRELQDAVAPYRRHLSDARIHLVQGEARQVIPAFARSRDFDLVVIGTAGRRGLGRWIIGNTAETVLATLRRSLLAVRPGR